MGKIPFLSAVGPTPIYLTVIGALLAPIPCCASVTFCRSYSPDASVDGGLIDSLSYASNSHINPYISPINTAAGLSEDKFTAADSTRAWTISIIPTSPCAVVVRSAGENGRLRFRFQFGIGLIGSDLSSYDDEAMSNPLTILFSDGNCECLDMDQGADQSNPGEEAQSLIASDGAIYVGVTSSREESDTGQYIVRNIKHRGLRPLPSDAPPDPDSP